MLLSRCLARGSPEYMRFGEAPVGGDGDAVLLLAFGQDPEIGEREGETVSNKHDETGFRFGWRGSHLPGLPVDDLWLAIGKDPVGCFDVYFSGAGSITAAAAATAPGVHTLSKVSDTSIDDLLKAVVPWGGTRSEVSAHRAGKNRALARSRTLSTGCLRQAAEMISIAYFRAGQ
ncbi:hypothetical protein HET69_01200 [Streptomyces sp. CJ_13]|uniref:hypothetical protein n=1 Tax=Streptomyces sp. CJ_13 TaxID=2724943 RepID=UPI001BDCA00D|nr:hypothetical protein [Streptomyces sp. CJ_13]MBT1182657.1 hypothetical protein [Streptomyces sp. CJ_13]